MKAKKLTKVELQKRFIKTLDFIHSHPTQAGIFAAIYALNDRDLDDIVQHQIPADYAKFLNVSRQMVNQLVLDAQEKIEMLPRSVQRTDEARQKMSSARIRQLT